MKRAIGSNGRIRLWRIEQRRLPFPNVQIFCYAFTCKSRGAPHRAQNEKLGPLAKTDYKNATYPLEYLLCPHPPICTVGISSLSSSTPQACNIPIMPLVYMLHFDYIYVENMCRQFFNVTLRIFFIFWKSWVFLFLESHSR